MAHQIKYTDLASKTGQWFRNASRSSLAISKKIITDMTPATIDLINDFKNETLDVSKSVLKSDSSSIKTYRATADAIKQALVKAREQIRTGDFSSGGDSMFNEEFFGDDWSFMDDDFKFNEDDSSVDAGSKAVQNTMIAASNMETNAINSQTAILTNLISTSTQTSARMSVANTKMVQQLGVQMTHGMQAINDNLSMLVKFQSETMGTFVSASMKYYDDSIQMLKMMSEVTRLANTSPSQMNFNRSLLSSSTGIDVSNYIQRVKKNIMNKKDSNMGMSMLSLLTEPMILDQIKNDPLGIILPSLFSSLMPGAMKNAGRKFDNTIKNFLPAAVMKLNGFKDDFFGGALKRLAGELFGLGDDIKTKIKYKKMENSSIPFDRETKNYIAANLVYQRKILSALTGSPEMIYDVRTNTFKYGNALRKKFNEEQRKASVPIDMSLDINSMVNSLQKANKNVTYRDKQKIRESLEEFFIDQAKKGEIPDISSRDKIRKLVRSSNNELSDDMVNLLASMINGLSNSKKMRMFGSNLIGSREGYNAFMQNIEDNPLSSPYSFMFDGSEKNSRFSDSKSVRGTRGYSTTSDSSLLFKEKTDRHGMSMFDYMYDLKYILLKGIRVFPNYRHLDSDSMGGPDPTDHLSKMLREMNEDAYTGLPNQKDLDLFSRRADENKRDAESKLDRIEREKFESLFMEEQYKKALGDEENEDRAKKSIITRFGNFLKKNTGLSKIGPFRKISQFARVSGDILEGTVNDIDDLLFKVIFGFDNNDGPSFWHQFNAEMRGIFTGFKDSLKTSMVGEDKKGEDGKTKGVVQQGIESISRGFGDLSTLLFGKKLSMDGFKDKTAQEIGKELREKMPRGMAGGVAGMGVSILGGSLGLLPSLLLPGGPIGAAILGSTLGFASQSEKFKEFVFGKKDENNERAGGIISKSLMDRFKSNKKALLIGGAAGALKSAIMGNGVLVGSLLGSGPIGGAIAGMGLGLLTSSEKFKSLLFGEIGEDGNRDKATGIIGKFTSSLSKKLNKFTGDSTGHKFDFGKIAAGVISGATGSAILGQMGLLGSLVTMGGSPILGALAGAATGITLSSDAWTKAIFGEVGEDGKRHGGKQGQIKNWLQINVGEPLKNKIDEYKIESSHWFDTHFADPLKRAIDPLTTALGNAVNTTKNFITHGLSSLLSKFTGGNGFAGNMFKYTGNMFKKGISGALGMADFGLRTTGSFLGSAISLPIRGAEGLSHFYNTLVANKNFKKSLKERRQSGELGFWSYLGQKYNRQARREYFENTMGYSPTYLKDWEGDPKRREEYEAKKARLADARRQNELKKIMAKQLGYNTIDAAGKDVSWIYDKDVRFEEGSDGKIKAIRNKLQTASEEKSQSIQMEISNDVTKIREKMDDMLTTMSSGNAELVLATKESGDKIVKQAEMEDKYDDKMSYEISGYDPVTKKKLSAKKDIDWLLSQRGGTSDSGDFGDKPENMGKEVESKLGKTLDKLFGGNGGGLFGGMGKLLLGGIGVMILPWLLKLLGLDGAGTDAAGNTIENKSTINMGNNLRRNFFSKYLLKPIYKRTGAREFVSNGIENSLKKGFKSFAGVGDVGETAVKSSDNILSAMRNKFLGKVVGEEAVENTTQAVINKASRSAFNETVQSGVEKASKSIVRESIEEGAEKTAKSVVSSSMTSTAKTKVKEYLDKAIKSAAEFLSNKKFIGKIGNKVSDAFSKTVIKTLKSAAAKILASDTLVAKVMKKIGVCVGKTIASIASLGLIDIAFAGWDFVNGSTRAETADLFKVNKDDVTSGMRIVSGAIKALLGYGWMVLIDLILEIINNVTGDIGIETDIKCFLATKLYELMTDDEAERLLKANQDAFKKDVSDYNKKNNTKLSSNEYSNMVNKSWGEKAMDAVNTFFSGNKSSVTAAQSYSNTFNATSPNSYSSANSRRSSSSSRRSSYRQPTSNAMSSGYRSSSSSRNSSYRQPTSNAMSSLGFGKRVRAGKGIEPDVMNDFAYYAQTDDRFANVEYAPSGGGRFSDPYIRQRACGPTSAAMVVKQLTGDKNITPVTMTQFSTANGCSVDAGTTWDFFGKVANKYGLQMQTVVPSAANLSQITKKTPMIISGTGGPFYGGHFVVGVKGSDSTVTINDPIGSSASKTYSIGSILPYMRQGFIFSGGDGDYSANASGNSSSSDSSSSDKKATQDKNLSFLDYFDQLSNAVATAVLSGKPVDYSFASSEINSDSESGGSTTASSSSGTIEDGIVLGGDKNGLFHISAKYESGGYDPGAIGNDSTGGYSYGLFQFATNGGAPGFVNYLKSNYPNLYDKLGSAVGTGTFNNNWKALASGPDAKKFQEAQEKFAYQSYYRGLVDQLPQIGFNKRKMAAKQIAFSTGIHLGTYQGKTAYNDIYRSGMSDSELITAIQDEKKLYFSRSTPAERAAVQNRLENEKNYALQLLKEQGGKGIKGRNTNSSLMIKPAEIIKKPSLLKKLASKGGPSSMTHRSNANLASYANAEYSKYMREGNVNFESIRTNDLLRMVVTLLASIDTNTASTVGELLNIKQKQDDNTQAMSNISSITANLFKNNNQSAPNTNSGSYNHGKDRSNMMEKMRLIARGGIS